MRSELKSLTGLRGVAACAVMVGHFTENSAHSGLVGKFLDHTYYAVDLFFVLSGFVLAMVYEDAMRGPDVGQQFGRFLGHRLARIYPLYALTTLVSFGLVKAGVEIYGDPKSIPLALVSNLLMTQSWGWPSDSLNGPGWSISTEWAANLLFPVFAVVVLRWSWAMSVVAVALLAAILAWSEAASHLEYWGTPILLQWRWLRVPQPLIGCSVEFMLGMYCWRLRRGARRTRVFGGDAASLIVALALTACMLTDVSDLWFIGLCCLFVLGLSFETSALSRLLGTSVLHRLGLISFSIYLVHAPMISLVPALSKVLDGVGIPHARSVANILIMTCALVVAQLSYWYVEKPSRLVFRRAFDRVGASRPATSG